MIYCPAVSLQMTSMGVGRCPRLGILGAVLCAQQAITFPASSSIVTGAETFASASSSGLAANQLIRRIILVCREQACLACRSVIPDSQVGGGADSKRRPLRHQPMRHAPEKRLACIFSPHGEAKCVRGPSGRGASRAEEKVARSRTCQIASFTPRVRKHEIRLSRNMALTQASLEQRPYYLLGFLGHETRDTKHESLAVVSRASTRRGGEKCRLSASMRPRRRPSTDARQTGLSRRCRGLDLARAGFHIIPSNFRSNRMRFSLSLLDFPEMATHGRVQ